MDKEEKTVSLWVETFASEESVAKHADAIAEMVHKSRLEEGCLRYNFIRSTNHGDDSAPTYAFDERWRSDTDLKRHMASEHFQRLAVGQFPKMFDRQEPHLYSHIRELEEKISQVQKKVLIFSKAIAYKHDNIATVEECLKDIVQSHPMLSRSIGEVVVSEDSSPFRDLNNLLKFDLIVFNNNSGELFDTEEKANFVQWVENNEKGVLGVHAATAAFLAGEDASGDKPLGNTWGWYGDMLGAHFVRHPPIREDIIYMDLQNAKRFGLDNLPSGFLQTDEWYEFDRVPCGADFCAVAWADKEREKNPIIWSKTQGKSRIFYAAPFHSKELYNLSTTKDNFFFVMDDIAETGNSGGGNSALLTDESMNKE